jgi:hypothetical protein
MLGNRNNGENQPGDESNANKKKSELTTNTRNTIRKGPVRGQVKTDPKSYGS